MNDNDPKFARSVYNATIPEDSVSGVFVAQVTASDRDTPDVQKPITYSLAQETAGYFVIGKETGKIVTGKTLRDSLKCSAKYGFRLKKIS